MLGRLTLRHFRCFEQFEAEFAPGTNFIVGPNARGKTSLLEAACILLRLQSPRITQLARVVQHARRGFVTDYVAVFDNNSGCVLNYASYATSPPTSV